MVKDTDISNKASKFCDFGSKTKNSVEDISVEKRKNFLTKNKAGVV